MEKNVRNSLFMFVTGLLSTIAGALVLMYDFNPPPIVGVIFAPLIFLSVPLAITGLILIVINLYFKEVNKKKVGVYIMCCGIAMFFIGIYGFSTYGLSYLVSKVSQFSFFFWLPTIVIGLIVRSISHKL